MGPVIAFDRVSKRIRESEILEQVSFHVHEHDVFGYLGPNGAGKTTSIRILLGLLRPTSGEVRCCGCSGSLPDKLGFVLEHPGLYLNLTARENLEFFDRLHNDSEGRKQRLQDWLGQVGLSHASEKPAWELSRGMKTRLCIARAMIANPTLLVLDEPMSGLDPEGQNEMKVLIRQVARGATVFMSSHLLSDVQELCNRVAILNKRLLVCGPIADITKMEGEERLRFTTDKNEQELAPFQKQILQLPSVESVDCEANWLEVCLAKDADSQAIIKLLVDNGVNIHEMTRPKQTLEEVYLRLLDEDRDG